MIPDQSLNVLVRLHRLIHTTHSLEIYVLKGSPEFIWAL